MRLVAADPALTEKFLEVLDHRIPPSAVFTPRLALRALRHAWRPGSRRAVLREAGYALAGGIRQMRRPRHPAFRPVPRVVEPIPA